MVTIGKKYSMDFLQSMKLAPATGHDPDVTQIQPVGVLYSAHVTCSATGTGFYTCWRGLTFAVRKVVKYR